MNRWFVPKLSNTYADALYATGLADLIASLVTGDILLRDEGSHFAIEAPKMQTREDLCSKAISPGYPYLKLKSNDPDTPLVGETIDYEAEKQKEQVYIRYEKLQRTGSKSRSRVPATEAEAAPPAPRPDLSVLKTFNSMRMGSEAYNRLHAAIRNQADIGQVVWQRLVALGGPSPTVHEQPAEPEALTSLATPLQLFNPVVGKGVHRPKANGTGVVGFPKVWVDWFQEWMKYRAMHLAMATFRNGDDTKVMVLVPADIPLHEIKALRGELLQQRFFGNLHTDIDATLILAETLIRHSEEYGQGGGRVNLRRRKVNQVLKGLQSAYFKSLGNASAVMNVSFLGLPGWLPIEDRASAEVMLEILAEHRACLRLVDESHSDEVNLLAQYRDFLSSGDVRDFLFFLVDFGPFVMRRLEQGRPVKRFSVVNLRRLFMAYDLTEIVTNDGFTNLADAIRRATVNAQYRKAQGDSPFEVRYGLAQEWKRKLKFKEELVTAICDFVQKYNEENARHAELGKERRKSIATDDLHQVLRLIEQYGSELVGMLLLAYGYAVQRKEADAAGGPASEGEDK